MNKYWIIFFSFLAGIFIFKKIVARKKYPSINDNIDRIWQLENSVQEEMPKWPKDRNATKNEHNIYVERQRIIDDTTVEIMDADVLSKKEVRLVKVAGETSGFYPLFTTNHNTEEHYLTQLYISFHFAAEQYFLDLVSLDKDYILDENTVLLFRFTDDITFTVEFSSTTSNENDGQHYTSIPLSQSMMQKFATTNIDKWMIINQKEQISAIGSLNFDVRKYVYKPEIQYTIQFHYIT